MSERTESIGPPYDEAPAPRESGAGAGVASEGVEGENDSSPSAGELKGKFRGSFSSDDPERPRWDRDTVLEAEFAYRYAHGAYAYSMFKGRRRDGEKAFLTGRHFDGGMSELDLAKRDDPDAFYKFPGLARVMKGKGDAPDLLYRLPDLIAAIAAKPDETVFICEGEKDADRLWREGLIATTNPNGALSWKSEFNEWFAGREVAVMVDNDEKGRKRAARIVAELMEASHDAKAVALPGLRENEDVSDWLDAGHTPAELVAFVASIDADALPEWVQAAQDDAEIARLAGLSPIEYDRARKDAAKRLRILATTLDDEVQARRAAGTPPPGQGTALAFAEIEPCRESVAGQELIAEIHAALKRHVVFPSNDHALATGLWAIHTHLLSQAEHSPRLHITAPTKACGKTVLLNTVAALVPRPLRVEHVTPAAMFRVIEQYQPTLLIDEVDTFLRDNEDMRGLLNAGHMPGGGVVRCVGEKQDVRTFSVFAATALAGIGEIPPTIEDRSITIPLRRRVATDEPVERLRRNRDHLARVAGRIARWAADNADRIESDPALPEALGDRAQDNWRPLVAIADAIAGELGASARAAALALEGERDHDDDAGLMALADVQAIFAGQQSSRLSSNYLVEKLVALPERPWPYWRRGNPLTQNSLARLLKPFGIKTKQVKAFGGKGYERAPVDEAFRRYCQPKDQTEIEVDDPM